MTAAAQGGFPSTKAREALERAQFVVFIVLLALYTLATGAYVVIPGGMLETAQSYGQSTNLAPWQLVLGNGLMVLVVYGVAGLLGIRLASGLGIPPVFRAAADWRGLLGLPLLLGMFCGLSVIGIDQAFKGLAGGEGFPHPPFPASVLASLTAGIGEEIVFRLLFLSLWAAVLKWILARLLPGRTVTPVALGLAVVLAALAFAAGHLGTALALFGVASPAELPAWVLAELAIGNGVLGLVAGASFLRGGLVAAAGVHFWADVVWHVVYGSMGV